MDILGSVASILSGGVTGLIGTAVGSYYTYKDKQLDIELEKTKLANELELKKADAAIMAQEWAAKTQVAQIETKGAVSAEEAKAFTVSLTSEPQRYATGPLTVAQNWFMVLLDLFRGVIRPSMTVYLIVLTTCIYAQARALIGEGMSAEQAVGLVGKIVDTVLYLTSTAILWYFGSRIHDKKR